VPEDNVLPLPADDDENYIRKPVAIDSYQNIPARLGVGAPNLINTENYPLVRLTESYPLILSLYRGSWVVRKVIDQVANDMYKSFPVLDSMLEPEQVQAFNHAILKTKTIHRLRTACKWGRLFGGAGAIVVIDGHGDLAKPLKLKDVDVDSYKGLIPLDRWSGIIPGPEINADINDPDAFGLPEYYNCIMDAGHVQVHHSRVLRFTGRELPQWEVQLELYWGMSEVEIIFEELKKRDYSSWNIVSLLTRAQVMSITEPMLASMMSGATSTNKGFNGFVERMEQISEQLNNQGLLILGKDGKLDNSTYSFGGISDVYHEFMKDLAAACGIPYEVIFGRDKGMGDGGELGNNGGASMQLYDNMIEEKRVSEANPIIDKLLPIICTSVFGDVPDDLAYHWAPVRAISDKERSDLGKALVESVLMAYNADLITKKEARKELAQQSGMNGLFSNISEESIAATPDTYASETGIGDQPYGMGGGGEAPGAAPGLPPLGQGAGTGAPGTPGAGPPPGGALPPPAPGGAEPRVAARQSGGNPKAEHIGTREGEQLPVEAKPIGVTGLKWHKSKRITRPEETHKAGGPPAAPATPPPSQPGARIQGSGGDLGTAGATNTTNTKSLRQSLAHSIKHLTKKITGNKEEETTPPRQLVGGPTPAPGTVATGKAPEEPQARATEEEGKEEPKRDEKGRRTFSGAALGLAEPMRPPNKKEEE